MVIDLISKYWFNGNRDDHSVLKLRGIETLTLVKGRKKNNTRRPGEGIAVLDDRKCFKV